MYAVIADDFTGAAEIAAIGLRYGLTIALFTKNIIETNADLIVVSSDSRSLKKLDAVKVTAEIIKELKTLNPAIIYKKTDSVLRGFVIDELSVQMELLGLKKALLLPANPSLKRTIKDGNYFIDGQPIATTSFAIDPEFAIKSSSVKAMLKVENGDNVSVLKLSDELPEKGIIVGEVSELTDIKEWINRINGDFALAGAGNFFNALLNEKYELIANQKSIEFQTPSLFISGTSFAQSRKLIGVLKDKNDFIHFINNELLLNPHHEAWTNKVINSIKKNNKAIIAIDENIDNCTALELRTAIAKTIKNIIEKADIKEMFIEGGSTAAAILEELNIYEFIPTHEIAQGVLRMKAANKDLFITVKPGSYQLPKQILDLYN